MSFVISPQHTWVAGQWCGPEQPMSVLSTTLHEFTQSKRVYSSPSTMAQQVCPGQSELSSHSNVVSQLFGWSRHRYVFPRRQQTSCGRSQDSQVTMPPVP